VTTTAVLQLEPLERDLPGLAASYAAAAPFPHAVLDDLIPPDVLARLVEEHEAVPDESWTPYLHLNERKFANNRPATWGPTLRAVADALQDERFVRFLEALTGFEGLVTDPALDGAGLHRSLRGGFLNVHADFTAHHSDPNLRRRVNLLLFLNRDWDPAWGGALELWARDMSGCVTAIEPRANRIVVFSTDETAHHGHPGKLACPPEVARRSLALYYFRPEAQVPVRSTRYRSRPGDGLRGLGIHLDSGALRLYDRAKRRLRLSDALPTRVARTLLRRRR
jgi:2OG-Fe(II) oxygenase superfamily